MVGIHKISHHTAGRAPFCRALYTGSASASTSPYFASNCRRWLYKLEDKQFQRERIHETQSLLKNQRKMAKFCQLVGLGGEDTSSESSSSGADDFGIMPAAHDGAAEAEPDSQAEELDPLLPLWTFDPDEALSDDLEELSEVIICP